MPDWPPLAWVARCVAGRPVQVTHGPMVEVQDNWFGEIIWDGDYPEGAFDQALHVFGSGGRLRDGRLSFVGSSSVLDRLHWAQVGPDLFVSNSIAALTTEASLQADPLRNDYPAIFRSICRGVQDYQRTIPMQDGEIQLAYMTTLHWDGTSLSESPAKQASYSLPNYETYRDTLDNVMQALVANSAHRDRTYPFGLLSTISTGYDSPSATAVARAAGMQEAFTIRSGRSGDSDDGTAVGNQLGVAVHAVSRAAWRNESQVECLFIAGDAKGEDIYVAGARELLQQRVLFTGYGGTRVWGLKAALNEQFQRGDQSGLSHCEARLHFGYLHVPVPFLVASQPAELRRISQSDAMQPWHVDGAYNCPIARRIVEDAGVDREAFGMKKKAASILLFDRDSFLGDSAEQDFQAWCATNLDGLTRVRRRLFRASILIACRVLAGIRSILSLLVRWTGSARLARIVNSSRLHELIQYEPRYRYLFPWALQEVQSRYRR